MAITNELIEQHYREFYPKLVKRMSFRAGTVWAAEDVVQTAYERAIRYKEACDPERFIPWFKVILDNAFYAYKNQENGYTPLPEDYDEAEDELPYRVKELMREINELIDTKSVVQIEVLKLYFNNHYSVTDIAAITPYAYKMIHQIVQRFRNELKELYKD